MDDVLRIVPLSILAVTLAGCSCNDDSSGCPDSISLSGCGNPCSDAGRECPEGLFCSAEMVCTAECTADAGGCNAGERCANNGQCVPESSGVPDGSVFSEDASSICAEVDVPAQRVQPTVILVVDKSASMPEDFEGGTVSDDEESRWDTVRSVLLDPDTGVLPPLEEQIRFGTALYTATNEVFEPVPAVGECPMLDRTAPALNNLSAIDASYLPRSWRREEDADVVMPPVDGLVGDDTPTGDSIAAVTQWLVDSGELPSANNDPVVYVLATDGLPDRCENGDPDQEMDETIREREIAAARQEVVDAVEDAFDRFGVLTYALFVGPANTDDVRSHMNDVARAGRGADTFFESDDADALRAALTGILADQVSCELRLEGAIQNLDAACEGTVLLGERELECNVDWRAQDPSRIEILGDACDELQAGAALRATFPCGSVVLL